MDNEKTQPAIETQSLYIKKDEPKPGLSLPPGYIVLWLVTILSLVLNVLILRQVAFAKQAAQQAIDDAIVTVGNLQDAAFTYTAVIEDTIPINADLGLSESIPVPVDENLPLDATISVPVEIGPFGTYTVTLPVSGTVPVRTTLHIVIDQPLHVSTTIPVNLEVPIEVAVKDTPLKATLDDVIVRLEALAAQLDRPLLSFGRSEPEITTETVP
ncbi:MAG: hypothetical protein JXB30_19910 [Anaerolineae bacterium]|nr:hypothetical protein [Anaerolineae bacterium]